MFSFSPLRIKGHVAGSARVGPEDTLSTKKALHDLGYYDIPDYGMTPFPDQPMFDGIAEVQKKNDLFHDRAMSPGGETETAINRELGQRAHEAASGARPRNVQAQKEPENNDLDGFSELDLWKSDEMHRINGKISELQNLGDALKPQFDRETDSDKKAKIGNQIINAGNEIKKLRAARLNLRWGHTLDI